MKNYLEQFYNEGFATTFYVRPIKYLEKKIKNTKVLKIISLLVKILYTVLAIVFAIWMFLERFPL